MASSIDGLAELPGDGVAYLREVLAQETDKLRDSTVETVETVFEEL